MIVNEIQRVGNHSQSTTERFSQSRCQNEVFQHLHSTNITCIQRENVTIVIVMDNNSNGTTVAIEFQGNITTYFFFLKGK